ncbi:MAG: hypothetical protein FWE62_04315 [Firmicutes bacterium]|nr:hypothetical protein [Bacillota bacterium]
MKIHSSPDTAYVRSDGSVMYVNVHSFPRPRDCRPSAARLYLHRIAAEPLTEGK